MRGPMTRTDVLRARQWRASQENQLLADAATLPPKPVLGTRSGKRAQILPNF